jgi:membrane protease YdiL (CAAX protease family)
MLPRRSDVVFVAVTFVVSWLTWAPLVFAPELRPAWKWLHLAGAMGPMIGALVAVATGAERGALRAFVARSFAGWQTVRWPLFAAAAPFVLLAAAAAVAWLTGAAPFDWTRIGRSDEFPELGLTFYALASFVCYGFGEEVGWRGYAYPRIAARRGPVVAAIVVGSIWAVWHLPLFAFAPGLRAMGAGEVAGWLASLLTGSFLAALLYEKSGRSVPVVATFHAALDVAILAPGPGLVTMIMGAALTVAGVLAAAALVIRDRRARVTRARLASSRTSCASAPRAMRAR